MILLRCWTRCAFFANFNLTEHIDTETAAGRAMWQMIGVLAELERSLIIERTRADVQAAKQRGGGNSPRRS